MVMGLDLKAAAEERKMKRSTTQVLYTTPRDFDLVEMGTKSATTRIGIRESWPVGHNLEIVDNQDEERRLSAEIVYNEVMKLKDINRTQAGSVGGGYSISSHKADFCDIYEGSDDDTVLSLVGFRVV